ncbi:unnamed protein product [Prorocentrum cordatum]|uniref:Uncharacterized protein n=1 Tax=Prorocentrum cordatum TaxID=2364126 RepID=A0ABN9XR09_9DINO|nr:unnamed protein product [Polarella glacialis]
MGLAIQASPHTVDPACASTARPVVNLARAAWDIWARRDWLTKLLCDADAAFTICDHGETWLLVKGPVGAAVASARRIKWHVVSSAFAFRTDDGITINMTETCP